METPLCASGRRGGSPIGGEWEGKKECVFVCDCVCFGPHMTHVKGDISDAAHVGVVFFGEQLITKGFTTKTMRPNCF